MSQSVNIVYSTYKSNPYMGIYYNSSDLKPPSNPQKIIHSKEYIKLKKIDFNNYSCKMNMSTFVSKSRIKKKIIPEGF